MTDIKNRFRTDDELEEYLNVWYKTFLKNKEYEKADATRQIIETARYSVEALR